MCDDYTDGYGTAFADRRITRARVEHWCEECSRTIKVGKPYRKISGTWEGDFFSMKMCERCALAKDWLGRHGHGWNGGYILEKTRECALHNVAEARASK